MRILDKLFNKKTLSVDEARAFMDEVTNGGESSEVISAVISIMKFRGETEDELAGFSQAILDKCEDLSFKEREVLDVCGTGGDHLGTFNISTASAIVISACGVVVAKHGNRAVTSECGSADVLEELGVKIDLNRVEAAEQLRRENFSFFFAPKYHDSFKHVAQVRNRLKVKTVFNLLGPLVNPLKPNFQLMGVYSQEVIPLVVKSLKILGRKRAIVVCSDDGLDEFSLSSKSSYALLENGNIAMGEISPEEIGLKSAPMNELRGGDVKKNAKMLLAALSNEEGAARDVVIFNSAAGLLAAGVVKDFKEGAHVVRDCLASKKALEQLKRLKEYKHA